MGKEFDAEVRITAIVTIACFLLCSKVRTIPSRFPRPGFPVQVSARNEMDGRVPFLGRVSSHVPEWDACTNPALFSSHTLI